MRRIILLLLALWVTVSVSNVCTAEEVHTPPVGSVERKAILDTLRSDIRDKFEIEVVFVVKWLKVKDGWAWAETHPQSSDGMSRYEPFIALLEKSEGIWSIIVIPSMEEDSPPVDDDYFEGLLEGFPGLPWEIFPWGCNDRS